MYDYERFEKLLQQQGITAYKVAKYAGVSQTLLSAWKKGKQTPGDMAIAKIASYMGVSPDYFGEPEQKEDAPLYYIDKDARELTDFLLDHPGHRVLLDATRKVKAEDVEYIVDLINRVTK